MTIRDIIIKYSQELEKISDTPRLDVELFLQKALGGVDRIYIHLNLNKELTTEQYDEFIKYINDRINGRPVAYIVGNREFMGLDFFVKEGVLIPRPDTETLVEEIIELCKNKSEEINILDIGTGSGAITVSLAKYIENSKVMSFDISDIPLEVGKINAINNEVDNKIEFVKSDVFSAIKGTEKQFDVIVSNPPYIPTKDIDELSEEVRLHDPVLALDGDTDGLKFYKAITKQSVNYLKENGYLCYEIGYNQAEDVRNIMEQCGYSGIKVIKDLAGLDRVVIGRLNNIN